MGKTCKHCGLPITGTGSNNAVLCISCWARILIRHGMGESQVALAKEFGVAPQSISRKVMDYASER